MKAALAVTACAVAALAAVYALSRQNQLNDDPQDDNEEPNMLDNLSASAKSTIKQATGGAMTSSEQLKDAIKRSENLRLEPYNLDDGGWTVGYGHFEKTREALPVLRTKADAEALFEKDLYERAEKWVNAEIDVELEQHEYDALVHIAYNMSPKSFKKFAKAVNEGQGIDSIASESVAWAKPHHRNGIRNRRAREVAMFNEGVYA